MHSLVHFLAALLLGMFAQHLYYKRCEEKDRVNMSSVLTGIALAWAIMYAYTLLV